MTDSEHDDDRHASLRHVFEASLEAIPATLAAQLARLTVFPGDFDLAAATAVLQMPHPEADHALAQLLSASLSRGRRARPATDDSS